MQTNVNQCKLAHEAPKRMQTTKTKHANRCNHTISNGSSLGAERQTKEPEFARTEREVTRADCDRRPASVTGTRLKRPRGKG